MTEALPHEEKLVRLPQWVRRSPGSAQETAELKRLLRNAKLNTVCEEARCPNIAECFAHGTATFMILGDVCTRGCRFCAVTTGSPHFSATEFAAEGRRVAEAAKTLGLAHVVVTSVARDDLADGGASGFVKTIEALREELPQVTIEVLVPDFRGNKDAVAAVAEAKPDVFNHNLETVPRLYRRVRPGAQYRRSLDILELVKQVSPEIQTKTGIMLGLGEQLDEVAELMREAHASAIDIFTAGQYLQPSREHLPVDRYLTPAEFADYEALGREIGFPQVFVGPLVRSSYHAGEFVSKTSSNN